MKNYETKKSSKSTLLADNTPADSPCLLSHALHVDHHVSLVKNEYSQIGGTDVSALRGLEKEKGEWGKKEKREKKKRRGKKVKREKEEEKEGERQKGKKGKEKEGEKREKKRKKRKKKRRKEEKRSQHKKPHIKALGG